MVSTLQYLIDIPRKSPNSIELEIVSDDETEWEGCLIDHTPSWLFFFFCHGRFVARGFPENNEIPVASADKSESVVIDAGVPVWRETIWDFPSNSKIRRDGLVSPRWSPLTRPTYNVKPFTNLSFSEDSDLKMLPRLITSRLVNIIRT